MSLYSFIVVLHMVHNNMLLLMHRSVDLDNLSRTITPIDSDQKVAFLHTTFKILLFSEVS